MMILTLRS